MRGMNRETGKQLSGYGHLKQSITDILTTPIGSRVMRRDYGSNLFNLVDSPLNPENLVDFYAAVGEALDKWEPRFRLIRIKPQLIEEGRIEIDIEGKLLENGQPITLEGIVL